MWPFQKRQLPIVTNAAYARWLRAQRPSWVWFFRLTEVEQEQLAMLGDEHAERTAVGVGYAVADPVLAEAGVQAARGDLEGEVTLAKRLAADVAGRILRQRQAPAAASAVADPQLHVPRRPPAPRSFPTFKAAAP
jgi:hypothetical protein